MRLNPYPNPRFIVTLTVLTIAVTAFACNFPMPSLHSPIQTSLPTSPPVQPVSTLVRVATKTVTVTPTKTIPPTITPSETIPPTATALPTLSPAQPTFPFPNGLITISNRDTLVWRTLTGGELASAAAPTVDYRFVHDVSQPALNLPFAAAYQMNTYDAEDGVVRVASSGDSWKLDGVIHVRALAGAPGLPVIAVGILDWKDDVWITRLYVGEFDTVGNSQPIATHNDPESYYFLPLLVNTGAARPAGVWFTLEAWGIGNVVFPPHQGLSYVEMASGTVEELLTRDYHPSALSPDQSWLAYTGPGYESTPLTIRNLENGASFQIPLRPETDRGAGYAVFSPIDAYVAWMEASGSWYDEPSSFQAVVRIATIGGQITAELPMFSFDAIIGAPVEWVIPVGWLDAETLLLQAYDFDRDHAYILQVRFDGSAARLLTTGEFATFTYSR